MAFAKLFFTFMVLFAIVRAQSPSVTNPQSGAIAAVSAACGADKISGLISAGPACLTALKGAKKCPAQCSNVISVSPSKKCTATVLKLLTVYDKKSAKIMRKVCKAQIKHYGRKMF